MFQKHKKCVWNKRKIRLYVSKPDQYCNFHNTPAMQARQLRHEGGKSALAISVVVAFFCPHD